MRAPILLLAAAVLPCGWLGAQSPSPPPHQGIAFTSGTANTYVDVTYDPEVVPTTGLTVEAWITYDESTVPTGGSDYWPTVVRMNPNPNRVAFLMRVRARSTSDRFLDFVVRTSQGSQRVFYAFAPGELLQWTHVAGTFDAGYMRLFINGRQVDRASPNGDSVQNTAGAPLYIGGGDPSNPGLETWNGSIDELRIWPFARTGDEVRATMRSQLSGMGRGILTFNLNQTFDDSSHGLTGTPIGAIPFVTNPVYLRPTAGMAATFGTPTTTCLPGPTIAIGSPALVGNQAFALHGERLPASSIGVFALSIARTPAPLNMYGIDLHLDPLGIFLGAVLPTTASGLLSVPLPLPQDPGMTGSRLFTQWAFVDPVCGPLGWAASRGLEFTIQ